MATRWQTDSSLGSQACAAELMAALEGYEAPSVSGLEKTESLLVASDHCEESGFLDMAQSLRTIADTLGQKVVVDLADQQNFGGLVVPWPGTGVLYTNQVGGTYCARPKEEGLYVPVWEPTSGSGDSLEDSWSEALFPSTVTTWLEENNFEDWFESWEDAARGGEAWIPVRLTEEGAHRFGVLGLVGVPSYFTYENSD